MGATMIYRMRLLAIVLLGMLCMSTATYAQSNARQATDWGLIGT